MLIKKPGDVKGSEITDRKLYLSRRLFLRGAVLAATGLGTGLAYRQLLTPEIQKPTPSGRAAPGSHGAQKQWGLPGEEATPYGDVTTYNNFYEFGTDKYSPARRAQNFVTRPWAVTVEGLVNKPRTFDLEEILKLAPQEDRIYRFRCVEGWSMVIPWLGFPLAELLKRVEPLGKARYVAFETVNDPEGRNCPQTDALSWPYVEGLRLDEAMHPLTILATGLYGEPLMPQNGAPLRLVVPWKYGFKSIKSVVRVRLVEHMPATTWVSEIPSVYGFFSNVNPEVDVLRDQAAEQRIGEWGRRRTLPFNGYAEQVASLYDGMDLRYYR
ncbi:MAG TPA: protein-methionine-sulfoxide reductase catalytic subunit MsrP [Pyrinomonadaceae bacterium]|nr:protein-methionine-sulfoxide reductase catalytic subunit MsrP [Pyrinomonadaceae bacterium]